ncbi:hypothetical protein D6158_18740 [Nocardia seriolae]|nr:hypothetical protein D6158_18740 [Nocardia seriolae]
MIGGYMTEQYRGIDPALYHGLDPEVAEVLATWAEVHRRHYTLDRWLVNGRSRQPVAVVCETDSHAARTMMLILKVLSPQNDSLDDNEFFRHRQAESDRSDFAAAHLSTFVHDAVFVPSGRRWITFQEIAAKGLENTEVLTVLLRRMLNLADPAELPIGREIDCTHEVFTAACRIIVAGVLGDWARSPFIPEKVTWDLPTFFERHLFDQLEPNGRLEAWARANQADMIRCDGESSPLPNPFAVAQGRLLADVTITPLLGRSHGDLHTDNALIRVRPRVDVTDYYLIDTALYEAVGPITRDPAHLVLYIIARSMEAIAPVQQSALIELLLDPIDGPAYAVPTWLGELIRGIDAETRAWSERGSLGQRWSEQNYLSLAACAMLFLGRTSTREADKPWFLRLAARAVAKFAEQRRVPLDGSSTAQATAIRSQAVPQPNSPGPSVPTPAVAPTEPPVPADAPPEGEDGRGSRKKKGATYDVRVKGSKGVQIGDHGHQVNKW